MLHLTEIIVKATRIAFIVYVSHNVACLSFNAPSSPAPAASNEKTRHQALVLLNAV
jgi:hypothetical protein